MVILLIYQSINWQMTQGWRWRGKIRILSAQENLQVVISCLVTSSIHRKYNSSSNRDNKEHAKNRIRSNQNLETSNVVQPPPNTLAVDLWTPESLHSRTKLKLLRMFLWWKSTLLLDSRTIVRCNCWLNINLKSWTSTKASSAWRASLQTIRDGCRMRKSCKWTRKLRESNISKLAPTVFWWSHLCQKRID